MRDSMFSGCSAPRAIRVLVCLTLLCLTACSSGGRPLKIDQTLADAQLITRVKTVLVNDARLGPMPIDVGSTGGVITLTGRVPTKEDAARAESLVRAVQGVGGVRSELRVEP
jgi:hyperosmotically inducible periplasmic protein